MSTNPYTARPPVSRAPHGDGLADVLERVLDKGLVIAGDIQLNLLDIEVITLKVRLLVASADTAQQMGIDWWTRDPFLSSSAEDGNGQTTAALEQDESTLPSELERRLDRLEALISGEDPPPAQERDEQTSAPQEADPSEDGEEA